MAPRTSATSYQVDVSVVVLDVVVTDRDGNPLTGLTRGDFELYEDGELQIITDFSEEGRAATSGAVAVLPAVPSAVPPAPAGASPSVGGRTFVIMFDESNMQPHDLVRARAACREFIDASIGPGDRVALLSYGGGLTVLRELTSDVESLRAALHEGGFHGQAPDTDVGSSSAAFGGSSQGGGDPAGQSGTIRFQDSPAIEEIQRHQSNDQLYKTLAVVGQTLAGLHGRKTLVLFSRGFDATFADHGLFHTYREMVNVLNGANIAIYTVDAGGLAGKTPGDASQRGPVASIAAAQLDSLKVLANDTGGQALVSSNDLGMQLERVAASTSHYYLLTYSPTAASKGAGFRDVKVKVNRKGARVLTRKGYYQEKAFAELTRGERKDHLEDALLSWVDIDELPIDVRAEFAPAAGDRSFIDVELGIDRGLLAAREGVAPGIDVLIYFRPDGAKKVAQSSESIALSAEQTLKDLRYVKAIEAAPGNYWLKVVVRDTTSGALGTASAYVTIPEPPKGPITSTLRLLVPAGGSQLILAAEGGEAAARGLRFGDRSLVPVPTNTFQAPGPVIAYLSVRNVATDPAQGGAKLTVAYVLSRGTDPVLRGEVPYQGPAGPGGEIPVHLELPLAGLEPGSYRLEVIASDLVAKKGMRTAVEFTLAPPSP